MESYDFVEGNQWEQKDLKKLEQDGRPALTFNKILPQLLVLGGMQRANRMDITALPRGSKDTQAADLMSNIIQFIEMRSNADYEQSAVFDDGLITGLGALEVVRSYDDDLEGELIIRAVDPMQVFTDPESRRADWDDARFVMKAPFRDVEELVFKFAADNPELGARIRAMAARMSKDDWLDAFGVDRTLTGNIRQELGDAFFDKATKKIRVLEVYYRTTKRLPVVVAADGEVFPVETVGGENVKQAAERLSKSVGGFVDARPVKVVRISTVLGWEELQDVESEFPTRRFPLIPFMPLYFRKHPYGLVRHLKDPQREINKRRSQVLHHINSSANSGWLNDAANGADPAVLEKSGSKPGVVVNHGGVEPKQIVPHPMPQGLLQLDALSDRDIKEIGVQAELAGQGTQRFISGRAIQARQFGGQVQVTRFFDQLRLTRKLLGELLVSVVPRVLSERRIREIVDQEVARAPEGAMASLIEQTEAEGFGATEDPVKELIARARKLRFDIAVDDAPTMPTQRQAAFQQLIQVATLFPGLIDPDIILEHTDLKNKEELIARLTAKMQQMPPEAAAMMAQSGRQSASASERLDVGDMGQQAQLLAGGQVGTGGE